MSYECPTGQRSGGRGSARPFYQSSCEVANSSNNQSVMDDWGTLTSVPNSRSSNGNTSERPSEKIDVWATPNNTSNSWATPNSSSNPWATGANTATSGARITSSYNAPVRNNQPEVDDWGTPNSSANATSAFPSATSTRRNETAVYAEPDDWGLAADAWSSVTPCKSVAPSTRSSAVATTSGDDWATEADVLSGKSGSCSSAKATATASEMNDWTGTRRTTTKSDPRLVSSKSCPFVWNGTIRHRSMSFRINMENLDVSISLNIQHNANF